MGKKSSSVARTAMPETGPVDNVIDLSEATFGRAVETYVEARTEKDEAEARMKAAAPVITGYVLQNGEHEKPEHPDDAKLDWQSYRVHHQFYSRMDEAPAVEWVQQRLADPALTDEERDDLKRLLVPTFELNREMWKAFVDRPNTPVTPGLRDKVENGSYKLVVRGLVNTTCPDCGAKIHRTTMNFCPGCGKKIEK